MSMSDRETREYLAKAAQAERRAAAFNDPFLQHSWATVASGYRELAELTASRKMDTRKIDGRDMLHPD